VKSSLLGGGASARESSKRELQKEGSHGQNKLKATIDEWAKESVVWGSPSRSRGHSQKDNSRGSRKSGQLRLPREEKRLKGKCNLLFLGGGGLNIEKNATKKVYPPTKVVRKKSSTVRYRGKNKKSKQSSLDIPKGKHRTTDAG